MILDHEKFNCSIKIADDYYSAQMSLSFYDSDCSNVYDLIISFITKNNIGYGIQFEALKEVCLAGNNVEGYTFAVGSPHEHGENATLTMVIDVDDTIKPKLNEDGSVNFKEMDFAHIVNSGEIIQIKKPATAGRDGTTITNKIIKCKPGKDLPLMPGENTVLSEDGLSIIAAADGKVRVVNKRVSIIKNIEIDTVGPETGNVYFSGDIHVKKNVLDGYTVVCDGNLVVDGLIEGSIVKVKGDLTVGKGIVGRGESDIVVNGKLVSHFIENANVYVKGDIETGEIINSSVLCDNQILVKGKKGLIIGGEITSKYMIEANQIGSKLGVLTSINLGVDAQAIIELKELKESLQELKLVIQRLKTNLQVIVDKLKTTPNDEVLAEKLKDHKDSLLNVEILSEEKQLRYDELINALKNVQNGRIKINVIYPDTIVKIGTSKYFIDSALKDCILTRSDDKVILVGF